MKTNGDFDVVQSTKHSDFYHSFQPIYSMTHLNVYAYEAFLRSTYSNPERLFRHAMEKEQLFQLDTYSIYQAIYSFLPFLIPSSPLFVNVFPSTMSHHSFPLFITNMLRDLKLKNGKRIVFEINEGEEIKNPEYFTEIISFLRGLGFGIALDDIGKGSSSLQSIIAFEPEYIKLDQYFSISLAEMDKKQKMVRLFSDFCNKTNTQLILEGIERKEDMQMAKKLGVSIGQGFYFGKGVTLSDLKGNKMNLL